MGKLLCPTGETRRDALGGSEPVPAARRDGLEIEFDPQGKIRDANAEGFEKGQVVGGIARNAVRNDSGKRFDGRPPLDIVPEELDHLA
jgi:hypothetical protein